MMINTLWSILTSSVIPRKSVFSSIKKEKKYSENILYIIIKYFPPLPQLQIKHMGELADLKFYVIWES